ncbi:MAG: methyltransferase domain-containing protein [Anaerolineae bacterium]|nr:methyltransferase domain-containing protein [Anaerolineae bacterium]
MDNEASRVNRPRQAARAAYNRISRWYDALAHSERRFVDAGLRMLAVQAGERVLEIGCGTGYALVPIARAAGASGLAVGLDIAEGMLAAARARLERAELPRRPPLMMADAVALPFTDGAFDAVFMAFTLELFDTPDIPLVLAECARVLHPGGRLGVVALSREGGGRMVRLYEWAHRRWPVWVDCRPIYARRALEDAGFRIVRAVEARMWGLPVEIVAAARV